MTDETPKNRQDIERDQLRQLRSLLTELGKSNAFYRPRLERARLGANLGSLEDFTERLPLTTKEELVEDQGRHPPFGTNLTYPLSRYTRFHQTSGTTGRPMRWLDTPESWSWMLRCWKRVFAVAGIGPEDSVLFPFSFGPFLGFWTAFDAAQELGCLAIPGGGLDSAGRLRILQDNGAAAVCCTPTYALRLAEVARHEGIDLAKSKVRALIVAGEPGGSVPAIRRRLAEAWPGARIYDHHGMTEVGPVSFPNADHPEVLHILETSYLAEVLDPNSGNPVAPGETGELVLTTLGRAGSPLLRYRTGDLVRPSKRSARELGTPHLALEGGILARADDMVVVRGVNLYPSAMEEIVRQHPEIVEYQVRLSRPAGLAEVAVSIELATSTSDPNAASRRLEASFRSAFQLRIPVSPVPHGTLPRFELKARRWVEG